MSLKTRLLSFNHKFAPALLAVGCMLGFLLADPAYSQNVTPIGLEFDFENEVYNVQCADCGGFIDEFEHDCDLYDHTFADSIGSCTGYRTQLPGHGFKLFVEASADGDAVYDGDIYQEFYYSVPYSLYRWVRIEDGDLNGIPVIYMTFPVISREHRFLVDGELQVDGNWGSEGEGANIKFIELEPGSHRVIKSGEYQVYTDGDIFISENFPRDFGTWEAPELVVGDTISLESYQCGQSNVPGAILNGLCTSEGEIIRYQSLEDLIIGVEGKIRAWSLGDIFLLPPFEIPIPIDGGEALSCFGKNSTLSSFDIQCNSDGISASVIPTEQGSVRYTVMQTGPNEWQVIKPPAWFIVTKSFSDQSTEEVEVTLTCNGGLPLQQSFKISEGHQVRFVIQHFTAGETDCEVTETGPAAGYTPYYDNGISVSNSHCQFSDIDTGLYTCDITNLADSATFTAHMEWPALAGEPSTAYSAQVTIACTSEITTQGAVEEGGVWLLQGELSHGESLTATVEPTAGTECWASQVVDVPGVETADDCDPAQLTAGGVAECTFSNSVFFEGIPMLRIQGLVLMALLVLGIGMLGSRRFA